MSVTAIKNAKNSKKGDDDAESSEEKGGKKKLMIIVAAVLVLAGAAYWFVLKPAPAATDEAPKPGLIVPLDSTQVNLASGHYLKIGIALQLVEGVGGGEGGEFDGSKALDATIELFSGRTMEEVGDAKERKHLKEELEATLEKTYEDEVMGIYFTEFVTQ